MGLAKGLPGLLGQSPGLRSEAVASEGPSRDPSSEAQAGQGQEGQAGLHPWLVDIRLDASRVDQVQPPGISPVVLSAPPKFGNF